LFSYAVVKRNGSVGGNVRFVLIWFEYGMYVLKILLNWNNLCFNIIIIYCLRLPNAVSSKTYKLLR